MWLHCRRPFGRAVPGQLDWLAVPALRPHPVAGGAALPGRDAGGPQLHADPLPELLHHLDLLPVYAQQLQQFNVASGEAGNLHRLCWPTPRRTRGGCSIPSTPCLSTCCTITSVLPAPSGSSTVPQTTATSAHLPGVPVRVPVHHPGARVGRQDDSTQ